MLLYQNFLKTAMFPTALVEVAIDFQSTETREYFRSEMGSRFSFVSREQLGLFTYYVAFS